MRCARVGGAARFAENSGAVYSRDRFAFEAYFMGDPQPSSVPPTLPSTKPTSAPPTRAGAKGIPVSKACPQCGSREYTRVKPTATIAFASDRVCGQCGTRYSPPTPVWAAIVFMTVGGLLTAVFGLLCLPIMIRLFDVGARGNSNMSPTSLVCPAMMCILGILSFVHGLRSVLAKR
jgi:hypothetical protein